MNSLRRFCAAPDLRMRAFPTALVLLLVGGAPAEAGTKADRKKAIQLFEQSEDRYREGQFTEAAELLREAYDLDPAPTLLYNLARALESAGDLNGAKDAYVRYLEAAPEAKDRVAIEARIANLGRQIREREELEARLAAERERTAPPPPPPPVAPPVAPPPQIVTTPPDTGASPVPWIVAGVGGAVVVSGVVLGLLASGRHDDAIAAPIQMDAQNLEDEANGLATAANASYIAGGVIVGAGLIWGLVTQSASTDDTVAWSPVIGDRSAGVIVSFE